MTRKLLLSVLSLMLTSAPSWSQEPGRWKFVAMGPGGMTVSIDTRTIEQSDGVATVWVQYWYPGEWGKYIQGRSVSKTLQREEYHCRVMQSSVTSYVSSDKQGEVVFNGTYPTPTFTPIVPDSMSEAVWRAVCV